MIAGSKVSKLLPEAGRDHFALADQTSGKLCDELETAALAPTVSSAYVYATLHCR